MLSEEVYEGFDQQDDDIQLLEQEAYSESSEIYIEAEEEVLPLQILEEEELDFQQEP